MIKADISTEEPQAILNLLEDIVDQAIVEKQVRPHIRLMRLMNREQEPTQTQAETIKQYSD